MRVDSIDLCAHCRKPLERLSHGAYRHCCGGDYLSSLPPEAGYKVATREVWAGRLYWYRDRPRKAWVHEGRG